MAGVTWATLSKSAPMPPPTPIGGGGATAVLHLLNPCSTKVEQGGADNRTAGGWGAARRRASQVLPREQPLAPRLISENAIVALDARSSTRVRRSTIADVDRHLSSPRPASLSQRAMPSVATSLAKPSACAGRLCERSGRPAFGGFDPRTALNEPRCATEGRSRLNRLGTVSEQASLAAASRAPILDIRVSENRGFVERGDDCAVGL